MDISGFKFTAKESKLEIYVSFTKEVALKFDSAPEELFDKAISKIETWRDDGKLSTFSLYEKQFEEFWKITKGDLFKGLKEGSSFKFVLGSGAPELSGFLIEKSKDPKMAVSITFDAPKEVVKTWCPEFLKVAVKNFLEQASDNPKEPCWACLHSLFLEARNGYEVKDCPLPFLPAIDKKNGYKLSYQSERRELILEIHHRAFLRSKTKRGEVKEAILKKIEGLQKEAKLSFLENTLASEFSRSVYGPETVGLYLPLTILVGKGAVPQKAKKEEVKDDKEKSEGSEEKDQKEEEEEIVSAPDDYEGKGVLEFDVSSDKMEAKIKNFKTSTYKKFPNIDGKWLRYELINAGIKSYKKDQLKRIELKIKREESLNSFAVAEGEEPTPPSDPYLEEVKSEDIGNFGICEPGTIVARVLYKKEGFPGANIFHEPIYADPPGMEVELLEGVEKCGADEYKSTVTGVAKVDPKKKTVSVVKYFVHKGDIDHASGNVDFDGGVRIKGNIKKTASVVCTGNLVVDGGIYGSFIKAANVTAKGGVRLTDGGVLTTDGDLKAEFAENSTIKVKRDLILSEALLHCHVAVGGDIEMDKKGSSIAGGSVFVCGDLSTFKVGFPNENKTKVHLGLDFASSFAIQNREIRLQKIIEKEALVEKELEELLSRSASELGKKGEEQIEERKKFLEKSKPIVKKLQRVIRGRKRSIEYNEESRAVVREILYPSSEIYIQDEPISISTALEGVCVTFKKKRGTHVNTIDQEEEVKRKKEKIEAREKLKKEEKEAKEKSSEEADKGKDNTKKAG